MNHKRGKPRQQRAGCPMCKWYKLNAHKDTGRAQPMAERRARVSAREQWSETYFPHPAEPTGLNYLPAGA